MKTEQQLLEEQEMKDAGIIGECRCCGTALFKGDRGVCDGCRNPMNDDEEEIEDKDMED